MSFTNDNSMNKLKPTSFELLKSYSSGSVVELPSFAEGQPFFARMSRPSMLKLAKNGVIPNSLLTKAADLFSKGSRAMANTDESMLSEFYDIMYAIADASLIEPTMEDIENAGLELTDEQLMAIFNYSQNGVKALEQFRGKRENTFGYRNVSKGQGKAK